MNTRNVLTFKLFLSFAIALFLSAPAQAGGYLHFGYGHHGGHYGYGHSYGYGYSYPYYGLHSYSGYGHHYYGHRYGGYGYPYYSHRESYASDYGNSTSSDYNTSTTYRGGSSVQATGNGWSLLGNNQASAALTDFGRQAQASPSKGDPKVGYALASADLGRLDKGVWAMRRALRIDPNALHYVALDQHLDAKVHQIIQQYEKKQAYSARDADTAFMLASLHYLRRDIKAARNNIDQAVLARHVSTSTKNLRALIDKEREG
ncbi:MAG: hypothetical protein Q9M08_06445 [Mariprofundus sp.]|nr:hypothetical protein [Mariprofundus sp.]